MCISYLFTICRYYSFFKRKCRIQKWYCKDCSNKVSAGVSTGIGDHESKYSGKETEEEQGDEQFEINDNRSLKKMYDEITDEGLQPVLNDYLYV